LRRLKRILIEIYNREKFLPGYLGLFINPFYFARMGLAVSIRELGGAITGKTLDIGCGTKPYESLFKSCEYIGLEIDNEANRKTKKADYYYDGHRFPFDREIFQSVVVNEVFEHVFNPDEFLDEINRVLKPGGVVLMTMPFVWDEHEQPFDFARYSSFGIKALMERHGFIIEEQRKSLDDIRVIAQMLNAYIYKITITQSIWLNILSTVLIMAPVNVLGELISWVTPRNPDLYLDNIVLARRID